MLDIKVIRHDPEGIQRALDRRGSGVSIAEIVEVDQQVRRLIAEQEALNQRGNQIAASFKTGEVPAEQMEQRRQESRDIKTRRGEIDVALKELEPRREALLLAVPNVPDSSVPDGADQTGNIELKCWGDVRAIHEPKHHYEIGTALGMLDFDRGVKLAGSRFTVLSGFGARLERALMNFMLDTHGDTGYGEVFPPALVNSASLVGTGQLPKFQAELFRCADDDLYLIPTAEVPVTNLYRDEIVDESLLPILHCAYTPCFRREAGAAGKDTRGYIRQRQFNKVELVKFTIADMSAQEHEKLTRDAEGILEALGLPYRRVLLCAGDMGFGGRKCYDLEVWFPAQNKYREISSCTNFGDFQARRANLRYRPKGGGKPEFMHTINGSGLAIGRTLAAILENFQEPDGSVTVPEVLRPYLGGVVTRIDSK